MSKKTKAWRLDKEENRLPSTYQSPVKPKPREALWHDEKWLKGKRAKNERFVYTND